LSQRKNYALTNARVVDGSGGPPLELGTVFVEAGHIAAVEQSVPTAISTDYEVVDLAGRTLIPGLIDMHVHLGYLRTEPDRARYDQFTPAKVALLSTKHVRDALMGGVTTVRDLGSSDGQSVVLRDMVAAGLVPGARVIPAGRSLAYTGGHCRCEVDGEWGFRRAIREQVRDGAEWIKFGQADDAAMPGLTEEELRAVMDEAHRLGRRVAVHVDREPGYQMAVRAGVDTVEHGFYAYDETLDLMAELGTYWVPTITINRGMRWNEYTAGSYEANLVRINQQKGMAKQTAERRAYQMRVAFEQLPVCFARGMEKGVKIVAGSDGPRADRIPMDSVKNEVIKFVEWGMDPLRALSAATGLAAEALDLDNRLGLVRRGFVADLVVLDHDPLVDMENLDSVVLVMKEGTVYRNDLENNEGKVLAG